MFAVARNAAKVQISQKGFTEDISITLPSDALPDKYTLAQLHDDFLSENKPRTQADKFESLLVLWTCLSRNERLGFPLPDDIHRVMLWVSQLISPDGSLISESLPEAKRHDSLHQIRSIASLGLSCLVQLQSLLPETGLKICNIDSHILITLIAFTSPRDPWTTELCVKNAEHLLSMYRTRTHDPEFITSFILSSFIRPLFSASKPSTITASSRAAISTNMLTKPHDFDVADLASKPWRIDACYAITVLSWAVEHGPQEIILTSFHLITPPILTLLDATGTSTRLRGLQILSQYLAKLTAKLLSQTGLGRVFEEAIFPTLSFLPTLTPVEESQSLSAAAYQALFTLADVSFANQPSTSTAKLAFFDKVLRKGVLSAYHHASEHPAIVELLLLEMSIVVQRMGMHSIKHLKDILPILTTVMTDPFATARPDLLLQAVRTLRDVLLNAWPRIGTELHRREVVRMLVSCWKMVLENDDKGTVLHSVREELKVVGRLLEKIVVAQETDFENELRPLLLLDESFADLFGCSSNTNV